YITLNGNVATGSDVAAGYKGVWDASANSPDLTGLTPTNGDWFYVSVDGTYDSVDYLVNDIIKYDDANSVWTHIPNTTVRVDQLEQEVSEIVYTTETALFNTDTSVFADGDAGSVDPNGVENGWYYQSGTSGTGKVNWYFTAAGAGAPQQITVGSLKNQFAVIKVLATGVPYFNIYTQPTGDGADAASWFRSRLTYLTFDSLDAYVGQTVLIYRGEDPSNLFQTMPHIEMELEPSSSFGPAGTDELVMFGSLSTSTGYPAGYYEFIAKSLGFTNGTAVTQFNLDTNDPVAAVQTTDVLPATEINFTRDATNTSIVMDHTGESYGVNTIKAVLESDGTISIKAIGDNGEDLVTSIQFDKVTITGSVVSGGTVPSNVVNALNALFTVSPIGVGAPAPTLPTLAGSATTYTLQEGSTPVTGTPTHLYTTGSDTSSGHGARLWTNETIDAAGEYFDVKVTGQGRFILGLVDNNDSSLVAELSNNSGNGHSGLTWGNAIYDYGSYSAPWTTYGRGGLGLSYGPGWSFSGNDPMMRYNQQVQDNIDNMDANLYRVGIDNNGYIYVAYYDTGRTNTFIVCARTSVVTPASDYALVVKLWSNNTTIVEAPTRSAIDDAAPVMNFRYIESPDGVYHYPLFSTEEEAEYYDEIHNGLSAGTGRSHTHTYADDTTNTTWYMPEDSHDPTNYSFTVAPSPVTFDGNNVTYSEIPTLENSDLTPPVFSATAVTQEEGTAVNIPVAPAGATWSSSVSISPSGSGLVYDGYSLVQGTLADVGADTTYTITVVRANSYGSTTGSMTVTATDVAPVTTNDTPWTKALDFSGSSERAEMATSAYHYNPMQMASTSSTVSAPSAGKTVSNGHPWATTCVFNRDAVNSNQHIWNLGDGAGSSDDNIYLRTEGYNGALIFGWGRQGSLNEHLIATSLGSAAWYGVYIGFNGRRLSGSDATSTNLANCFTIKLMFANNNNWIFNPNPGSPPGTGTWTSTGGRMDRAFIGPLTIGGRGSNRSYHGKVASFVTTTLLCGQDMPSNEEILEMTIDPLGWVADYKEGNNFRKSQYTTTGVMPWNSAGPANRQMGTQIYLMGDGTNDSYSNMIRNQVNPSDQNFTKLNMISMVSNDIQTVNIDGLS
ncbi:MAG: hypothetical protein GY934_24940, partial [Gammaproteobacteria bacterium]|nr:hypothetical protein [Gammaproteobacteria bacterium]